MITLRQVALKFLTKRQDALLTSLFQVLSLFFLITDRDKNSASYVSYGIKKHKKYTLFLVMLLVFEASVTSYHLISQQSKREKRQKG